MIVDRFTMKAHRARQGPFRFVCVSLLAVAFAVAALSPALRAAGHGEPGPAFPVRAELRDRQTDLDLLNELGIDVEAVFDGWARLYVIEEELNKLRGLGFDLTLLPDEGKIGLARMAEEAAAQTSVLAIPTVYHDYDTLTAEMHSIAEDHSDLVRLHGIGASVQGRQLWAMKITANPEIEEDEPELLYIGAMHGDEVVGKELLIHLIHHLTDDYGSDSRVTDLVDGAEIWILPSMNPDGTELGQRYNADGYDLNRSFPDQFVDPVNSPAGRPAEVGVVMTWTAGQTPTLSSNFHGGALVANYPFDSNPEGTSTFSPAPDPDHPAFYSLARTYADNNPSMYASTGGSFDHGVTNGADWYSINGGMQDWRYVWHGGFEVLMEISSSDWPPASTLPAYWDENLESMLAYFERAYEGLRGIVTDANSGAPLAAEIRLDANPFRTFTDPDVGDYHRIVLPGTYSVEVSAPGYTTRTFPAVLVSGGDATRLDVALAPLPGNLQPAGSRVEDGGNGLLDPGETTTLAVSLRNSGSPFTGISATLEPVGWQVEPTRPLATFPDIAMNETAESDAPHYEVRVSPAAPPGHQAGFYLRWEGNEGRGISEAFFLRVGEPDCETVPAADLPQTVSMIMTANSELQATARQISSVRVTVDIQHTYIGDLTAVLTAPSGTTVLLHDHGGGSLDDLVGTYPDDLTPVESLSALIGEQAEGTWSLEVSDSVLINNGSLEAWSLELCGYPAAPTPEIRFRDLTVQDGGVRLEWWAYPDLAFYRVYRSTDPSTAAAFVEVTAEDGDPTDALFLDGSTEPLVFYLVTGVGPLGEGPLGHFGQ
jgi:carboxypeptidase D